MKLRRNKPTFISNIGSVRAYGSDVEDITRRAVAAGAVPPLRWLGTGETAMVFCDANGRGWKVARDTNALTVNLLAVEAEWLATAANISGVAEHVARLFAWHQDHCVIERECVKPRERWQVDDRRLLALHNRIGVLMRPYGWTSPEYKIDSWVVTSDRGPVLVDAGRALRIGWRNARHAVDVMAGRRAAVGSSPWLSLRYGLESDATSKLIPTAVANRIGERLRSRENPAIARRGRRPPRLTRGHYKLQETIAARKDVEEVFRIGTKHHILGNGAFGLAYHLRGSPVAVKLPTATDLGGHPWSRSDQRDNLLNEAGVANELAARGYTIVPRIVYIELKDGTPALAREYGEPVTVLTRAEFEILERETTDVELKAGWDISDDQSLYRRADGSIFVGDVGEWVRRTTPWIRSMSVLGRWLEEIASKLVGIDVATLPHVFDDTMRVRDDIRHLTIDTAYAMGRNLYDLTLGVTSRRNAGLSVPTKVIAAVTAAERAIKRGGPDIQAEAQRGKDSLVEQTSEE